ncbi:MAG: sigma 54-interacting transcriptional regulator [Desulforhopalus sp.]
MANTQAALQVETLRKELEATVAENERLSHALLESEACYSRMLDNLKDEFLFYRHDKEGQFTFISPSYANILGYAPEEYLGLNAFQLWTPNEINRPAEQSTQLSCQGIRQPPYEMELYHKSGAVRRFVTIETPIFNDDGQVIAVEGTARDITEKRKIEEQLDKYRLMLEELVEQRTMELEASRKQLADIIDFLPYPISVVDSKEKIIAWNRAMVEITGVQKSTVMGNNFKHYLESFYSSDEPLLLQLVLEGIFKEDPLVSDKVKRLQKDYAIQVEDKKILAERVIPTLYGGDSGEVWITAGAILDHENQVVGAIESMRDVTRVKEVERQVLKSERRLSTLMGNLPGMAYRITISENSYLVDFVSEGCRQIFGREPSYFVGRSLTELKHLIHHDDLDRLFESSRLAVAERRSFGCEYRILTDTGDTKWVFDKAQVISRDFDGGVSIEGFMADFTVFKSMERKLRNENTLLRLTIRDRYKFKNIIGNCQAMQDVFDLIVRAATTEDNVFVYGESGTGKELVAQAIHDTSDRKDKNFIAVNCSAIPESLIESEFFGTAKGAFTGANADKKGYLEAADGGTLFLDEIGDISPNLQVKLLRAIDGGGFSPVGSRRVVRPDLRIIAASNKDLQLLVGTNNIRQDFFFRIHVIPIHLPPLRERGDDIFILINHFLKEYGSSHSIASLSREELEALKNHRWPGNIRELQNVLRRFITMKNLNFMQIPGLHGKKEEEAIEPSIETSGQDLKDTMLEVEKKVISKALDQTRWNKTKAAKELGISRKTLFRKMKACGLK